MPWEARAVERPVAAPTARDRNGQPTWAQPRNDGSQTARASQGTSYSTASYMKPTYASGGGSGSVSHRGAVPSRDSPPQASVKEAPKLAYNVARHKEASPSPDYGAKPKTKVPSLRMPSKLEDGYASKAATKQTRSHDASAAVDEERSFCSFRSASF